MLMIRFTYREIAQQIMTISCWSIMLTGFTEQYSPTRPKPSQRYNTPVSVYRPTAAAKPLTMSEVDVQWYRVGR